MRTIIEYREDKPAENAYPVRITSPPTSGPCCLSHMEQVGEVQEEKGHRFVYRRCTVCGFAVRRFLARSPLYSHPRAFGWHAFRLFRKGRYGR